MLPGVGRPAYAAGPPVCPGVVPVPVPTTLTVDVAKVEGTPVGVSGSGRDVATGVVASVSLDVELGARLDDE